MPRPIEVKLKIWGALSECAPACILSAEAVGRLTATTGLTASQIQKSAENFRRKTPYGERFIMLKLAAAFAIACYLTLKHL